MKRHLRPQALAVATSLALAAGAAGAVERVDLSRLDVGQLNQRYEALAAQQGIAPMAHTRHEQLLGMDSQSRLLLKKRHTDFGKRNTRYVQTFRGIPVYGADVVVSQNAASGEVEALFGQHIRGLANELPATAARIAKAQALVLAKRAALGTRLMGLKVENESAEQMIYIDDAGRAHLAYVVSFFADAPAGGAPTRPLVIVDANNGRILEQRDNLQHALIGTGPGGNQKTGQYEYGTDFGYLDVTQSGSTCTMNSPNVKTVDLNHGTSGSTAYSYTCPRNTRKQINGAYSPLNDAHYFGNVVFNMYDEYMGAAPLSFQLMMRVHYSTNYENAFWNGSSMTFGDGASTFYPLVSLDVSAHEVSHGYTEQNSNLVYDDWHPGGMNEAFSDIAGEAAEYYMNGTNDFLVGAQIFKSDGALRYMCDPTQDGISIDHADDMPSGGMNNHYSSGVYNKAFCTLAKTSGWTTKTAFQAFARANRDYWTSNSTWNQGACGVQRAAADMGMNVQQVASAFAVVGVTAEGTNCGGGGNTPPVANFTSSVNGLTVQFTDTSTDSDGSIASRSWNFGDGTSSTETNPSKTYSADGTYTVKLTVTDDDGATNTKTSSVTVGDGGGGGSELENGVPRTGLSGAQGSVQYFTLEVPADATNLKFVTSGGTGDADMYVKFGSQPTTTSYDCRPYLNGNNETCSISNVQAGTYHVMIRGYSAFSGLSLTGSYDTGGGGGTQTYTNGTDYAINDNATVESPISVSGRSGNGLNNTQVQVAIQHTYIGDLKVDLVAPDGSVYVLHNRSGGSANNINKTYTVNLSSESLNGSWKLRVNDNGWWDTGKIDSWSITF